MIGCRPFTDDEIARLRDAMAGPYATRNRALLVLGVRTGYRISELLSLRVCDFLENGKLRERVAVARRFMKGGKKGRKSKKKRTISVSGRSVILHREAGKAVLAWITEAGLKDDDYVFSQPGHTVNPITRQSAWQILRAAADRAKIPWPGGTHAMRKTFAGHVYEKLKHDIFRTQKAMGHSSIGITAKYLSFKEEDIDAAVLED